MEIPLARAIHSVRVVARYALERDTLLRSTRTALVVGTILALLNHGQEMLSGIFAPGWVIPMLLTYLVPFSVATYGQVRGKQQRDQIYTATAREARETITRDQAV